MNKYAAENVARKYYNLGVQYAMQKAAALDFSEIQNAMEAQEALYRGSAEDRIGNAMEQRRREGAIAGTLGGFGVGSTLGAFAGSRAKSKALMALGALLGGGAGAVGGNLLGRASGLVTGAVEGGLEALPGVKNTADYLSRPLDEY